MSIFLAIETSCDETAGSVVRIESNHIHILSNIISSQVKLHAPHGGVIPNLAAREHTKNISHVIQRALDDARVSHDDLEAIAVTYAPGLIPALLVGTVTTKTLSWLWQKPLIPIHHIEGHIYANALATDNGKRIRDTRKDTNTPFVFPLLALVVSGGHTQLILMRDHFDYEIVGETQDDAVGEAFDKTARLLGLGYPGGPEISKRATIWRQTLNAKSEQKTDNGKQISGHSPRSGANPTLRYPLSVIPSLPRPMLHSGDLNFSFSGLKTAVLTRVKNYRAEQGLLDTDPLGADFIDAMSMAFEDASTEVLVKKTITASKKYHAKMIMLAGGVSANTHLQQEMQKAVEKHLPATRYSHPPTHCITDNAAMIGAAASMRWARMSEQEKKATYTSWTSLEARADLSLNEINT